ncbi:hypothetical protein CC1G_13246 [Coprinopsis cinerea okayama7|uniref:Uncharacterized protein n=1 Tax=Coprinopsis cinerea (strain Okayama-7 / 130 / ATCC MYA-4618 / FGSC 9003) TaxID=240176 RepID=A8PI43_COPC7|nr:hypothetical protein CC1G_13246 [Coprinopsis cinerea okayama7\|eukprot:XP_001841514.2 hypothetical protein CC1G_13246 [Coprinopsis cinerea okayama7\
MLDEYEYPGKLGKWIWVVCATLTLLSDLGVIVLSAWTLHDFKHTLARETSRALRSSLGCAIVDLLPIVALLLPLSRRLCPRWHRGNLMTTAMAWFASMGVGSLVAGYASLQISQHRSSSCEGLFGPALCISLKAIVVLAALVFLIPAAFIVGSVVALVTSVYCSSVWYFLDGQASYTRTLRKREHETLLYGDLECRRCQAREAGDDLWRL